MRAAAGHQPGIDREAYATSDRGGRDPIIGLGRPDARLSIFERDPGRVEVE